MPGIVTSSGDTGSVKTYKMIFTSTSTSLAMNFVTGTTSGASSAASDKGVYVVFQNQSTVNNVVIGGPAVTAFGGLGSGAQGMVLGALTTGATNIPAVQVVFTAGSFSGVQMADWYALATSTGVTVIATLLKGV